MPKRREKELSDRYDNEMFWYDEQGVYRNFCNHLSKKLANITLNAGLSQAQMADLLQTNRQTVSDIARRGGLSAQEMSGERAIRKTPAYLVWRYSWVTGVPVEEILDFSPTDTEKKYELPERRKKPLKKQELSATEKDLIEIFKNLDDKQKQLLIKIARDINETR